MLFGRPRKNPIIIADKKVSDWSYATCGYCSTGCAIDSFTKRVHEFHDFCDANVELETFNRFSKSLQKRVRVLAKFFIACGDISTR